MTERYVPQPEIESREIPIWPPAIHLPHVEHTPITDEALAAKRDKAFDIRRELAEMDPLRR